MTKTVIQIQKKTRDMIKSLGTMGETYDDVLQRLYKEAVENAMAKTLLDTTGCTPIEEILKQRKLL